MSLHWVHLEQVTLLVFFPTIGLMQETKKNPTDKLHTRTNFQCFVNKALRSAFKKPIISMPSLLRGLRTMSLAKSVPDRLKPQECERTKLRESPPVPYIPEKDKVQEEDAKVEKPPNQDIVGEGHHTQLSCVAQEWDPRGLSHACDSSTGCHQEAWSLQGL